jgi:tripartite-type tricarboxylate transporter receptor subunit TctC
MKWIPRVAVTGAVLSVICCSLPAAAQQSGAGAYPVKSIRLVVLLAAGGPSDHVVNRLREEGAEVVASTPEEYGAHIRADIEKWARVIKEAGIRAE